MQRAFDTGLAVHQRDEATHDRQSETRTPVMSRGRCVDLRERLEQRFEALGRDSYSGIANFAADDRAGLIGADEPQVDRHLAFARELDCIAAEIEQHLAQAARIAHQPVGQQRVDDGDQLESLRMGLNRQQVRNVVDGAAQVHVDALEVQLSGFDLRKVEDVVDDGEQARGAVADRFRMVALHPIQIGVEQQLRHADHAVHRRPDLVAHVGQELGFHLGGEFGPILGLQQFGIGQLEIPRAQCHLLAKSAGQTPQAPHPQAVPRAREGHDGDHAGKSKPDCLKEMRFEGEAKARAGVAPHSIIVAGNHLKGVRPGRQPGVVGSPAVPRIDPALVETIEPVPEE